MNAFIQNGNYLLGSPEEIEKLAKKSSSRILVISDSHRHPDLFLKIVKQYGKECDALVFTGDGSWDLVFTLNDLFNSKDKKECLPPVVAFVRGNGDSSEITTDFDPLPKTGETNPNLTNHHLFFPQIQLLEASGKKIYISHGHLQGVDYDYSLFKDSAKQNKCSIILHGHTHICRHIREDGIDIINPGSIALPRCGTPPSFGIVYITPNFVDTTFIKIEKNDFKTFTPLW